MTPDDRRGVGFLLLAAGGFSVMSVLVKLAGRELPVGMLVLARAVVTLVLSWAMVWMRGIRPWGTQPARLVLRALFGIGGLACFYYSLTALPLAEATVLHFLNPILTAVLAAFWLKERLGARLLIAIALALAGTIVITRPAALFDGATTLPLAGVLAALGGAVFSALAYVTVRSLSRTESTEVIVLYFALVATPATLPFALVSWVAPDAVGWLLLVGLGVFTQIGQVFLTRGITLVPAGRATTIGYVQILLATLWGWLLFAEAPTAWTLAGAALIAVAIAFLLSAESRAETTPPP
jgi:drug/metabolite transporter (DMT)-like permease